MKKKRQKEKKKKEKSLLGHMPQVDVFNNNKSGFN
jgi:hypothetical protein